MNTLGGFGLSGCVWLPGTWPGIPEAEEYWDDGLGERTWTLDCLVGLSKAFSQLGPLLSLTTAHPGRADSPQPQAFFKMAKHPSTQKAKNNMIQHGRSSLRTKRYTWRPKSITASSKGSQSRDVHTYWADLFIPYLFLNVS